MRSRVVALAALVIAADAGAQSIRVTGASWFQSIDLRPLRRDSVRLSSTTESEGVRRAADGTPVSCSEGAAWCALLGSGPRQTARPLTHDVSIAAWGLGEGVSFHAHGRGRASAGGDARAWPRMGDRFDLIDAFVEVDRDRGRLRLGRQWTLGGLGAYSYDGASGLLRAGSLDGEAFVGQALVQGLNEAYTSAEIGQVDDLPPEQRAWMLGGRARWRSRTGAVSATYLRTLADDRSGLFAERGGVDATARAFGIRLGFNAAWDLAQWRANELQLNASRALGSGVDVTVEARRHRPFFELWTIWGAFAPVGFDEARVRATRTWGEGRVTTAVTGAWRTYEDPGTGLESVPLRTDGWRLAGDATWVPDETWSAAGRYAVDIGVGSSQSDFDLDVSRLVAARGQVGASVSAVQTIYEYRVGTGRVLGASAFALVPITSEWRVRAEAGEYRHRLTRGAPGQDWSQRRMSIRLEWAVGADPGASR